jgi:hypothetical protein
MDGFYKFAGTHPLLTIFLFMIVCGAIVKIIPWSKDDE